jgi:hypothetical protein
MREYDLIADWFASHRGRNIGVLKRWLSPPRCLTIRGFWTSAAATACRSPKRL